MKDSISVVSLGVLSRADDSVLGLSFKHGLAISKVSETEAIRLLDEAHTRDDISNRDVIHRARGVSEEGKVYLVKAVSGLKDGMREEYPANDFYVNYVRDYFEKKLGQVRLFTGAALFLRYSVTYGIHNGLRKGTSIHGDIPNLSTHPIFSLDIDDLPKLQEFVDDFETPFQKNFIQLAYEHYDLSFRLPNLTQSFLALIMSLESLFNIGQFEVTYQITRNAAMLLSNNREEFEDIWTQLKGFYKLRSLIVHSSKKVDISYSNHFIKLRDIVRMAILRVFNLDKSKRVLHRVLSGTGFSIPS